MRVSREQSHRQTRERLIAAAQDSIAEQGFDGCSIGAIVERAGFTKGAFFSNFENKEALLLELLERHYTAELEQLAAMLDSGMDSEALQDGVSRYIDALATDWKWVLLGIELSLRASRDDDFGKRYRAVKQQFTEKFGALLGRWFERGGKRLPMEPCAMGSLVLSVVHGLVLAAAAGRRDPPAGQLFRLVMESLIATAASA